MEKTLNKKRSYEISFLLRSEEDVQTVVRHLSDRGAEIVSEGSVDKIRLAYTIEKENEAFFSYLHFTMDPAENATLNNALTLDKAIIRFLIVTPPFVKSTKRRLERRGGKDEKAEEPTVASTEATEVRGDISNESLEKTLKEMEN
jgi:ribosomal protein S6